jgi:hypothetical protein
MIRTLRVRRGLRLTFVGVAFYAIFLVVAPFEHHDLLCHLKTPQHCTSCSSTLLGSSPHSLAILGSWHLADAGSADAFRPRFESTLLAVRSTGRSPPSL